MRRAALLLAAALGASGCDGVRLYNSAFESYGTDAVQLARAGGPLPVEILAPPVDPDAIRAALDAGPSPFGLRFGPATPADPYGYRLVLDFGLRRASPCAADPAPFVPPADAARVTVGAAFCRQGGALSRTVADGPRPAGPDDPALRRLLAGIVLELFPPRLPENFDWFRNN